jgi:hypothetical protein
MREEIGGMQSSIQQNETVANGQIRGGGQALFAALAILTAFSNDSLMCDPGYIGDYPAVTTTCFANARILTAGNPISCLFMSSS